MPAGYGYFFKLPLGVSSFPSQCDFLIDTIQLNFHKWVLRFIERSPHEPCTVDLGANQVVSELSSTVTEILSEKDMKTQGNAFLFCMMYLRLQYKEIIWSLHKSWIGIFYVVLTSLF